MKNYIITEGQFDLKLLSQIIPNQFIINTKFFSAGGYSSALSLAKSLLEKSETKKAKIFLILDADTIDEIKYKEKTNFINQYIGSASNFKLILFKPEIETVLFESKNLISRVAKREISDLELDFGKSNPRDVLRLIGIKDKDLLLQDLTPVDIDLILKHLCFVELINELSKSMAHNMV